MRLMLVFLALFVTIGLSAQDLAPPADPAPASAPDLTFNPPLSSKIWDDFSLQNLSSKGHKALGYATVTLGVAAIVVKKFEGDAPGQASTAHRILGESAAIGAGVTVLAGFVAHFDKLSFSGDLWTWNNLHALTALVGASLMGAAGLTAPGELHSTMGEVGTALMAVAIVLEG